MFYFEILYILYYSAHTYSIHITFRSLSFVVSIHIGLFQIRNFHLNNLKVEFYFLRFVNKLALVSVIFK